MARISSTSVPIPPSLVYYAYVDGQYVREELRHLKLDDRFNPRAPADAVSGQKVGRSEPALARIFYYDAVDDQEEDAKRERQQQYLQRVQRLPDTHVVQGEISRGAKRREQKGVDVRLAVDALKAAFAGDVQMIGIVSGDADFAPLAQAIREAGPHVVVVAFERSLSASLRDEADRVVLLQDPGSDWALPA